jgi:large subunit ribosomal protein L23
VNDQRLFEIIRTPVATEKSARLEEKANQYVFKVQKDATKADIKTAIESNYKVQVGGVQTVNMRGKNKARGTRSGRRNHWKKAYIRLQEGQEVNFFVGE